MDCRTEILPIRKVGHRWLEVKLELQGEMDVLEAEIAKAISKKQGLFMGAAKKQAIAEEVRGTFKEKI